MTSGPVNSRAPFLQTTRHFPVENKDELGRVLDQMYTDVATFTNTHEIGKYELQEILTGQQWFTANDNQKKRSAYRKVVTVGAIAAGATANIAHGITGINVIVELAGVLKTAVPDWRPIPWAASAAGNDFITMLATGANIVIDVGAGSPAITSGYVVIEYLKN